MKTQPQERDSDEGHEGHEGERLTARIAAGVLGTLGRPGDLLAVHVRRLWGLHYRVNVLTGADVTSAAIAHSYFLTTDEAGNILEASPDIAKLY